jgi:hypothetical protein
MKLRLLIKKVVKTGIKKVNVPYRHRGCQNWNQKGWCSGRSKRLLGMESKRLTSRIVDMVVKKVDVSRRHRGCQNWNQKGWRLKWASSLLKERYPSVNQNCRQINSLWILNGRQNTLAKVAQAWETTHSHVEAYFWDSDKSRDPQTAQRTNSDVYSHRGQQSRTWGSGK